MIDKDKLYNLIDEDDDMPDQEKRELYFDVLHEEDTTDSEDTERL